MPLIFRQLTAVLDGRTTIICLNAAGQIVGVKQPFETIAGVFMNPPFHVHCRSIAVPWVPGFVNEQRRLSNAELQRRPLAQRDTRNFDNRIPGPDGAEPGVVPPSSVAPDIPEPVEYRSGTELRTELPTVQQAGLSDAEDLAVSRWQGTRYEQTNDYLRSGGEPSDVALQMIDGLDSIFATDRGLITENVQVWRGIDATDLMDELQVGDLLIDNGYMATSFDELTAKFFTLRKQNRMVFRILIRKGQRAINLESSEGELLVDRGSGLRVTGITESDGYTFVDCTLEQADG